TTAGYEFAVARLTATGALDTSFDGDGKGMFDPGYETPCSVAIDSLDRVVVAGYTTYAPFRDFLVVRVTAVGALDSIFDVNGLFGQTSDFGGDDEGCGVAVDSLVPARRSCEISTAGYKFAVARLTATGALDSSFDGDGKQTIDFGGFEEGAWGVAID